MGKIGVMAAILGLLICLSQPASALFVLESQSASGTALDSKGRLFVSGRSYHRYGNSDESRWTVRRSDSAGRKFETIDSFGTVWKDIKTDNFQATSVVIDSKDRVFVAGQNPGRRWIVKVSHDSGSTWSIIKTFNYETFRQLPKLVLGRNDEVFLFADDFRAPGHTDWVVMSSSDHGVTWNEYFRLMLGHVHDLAVTKAGDIFVVGEKIVGGHGHWATMKTSDSGASWQMVDDYFAKESPNDATPAVAEGVAIDPVDGSIYVVGSAYVTSSSKVWVVRKSTDNGLTWRIVDKFRTSANSFNAAAVVVAPDQRVFVLGSNSNSFQTYVRSSADLGKSWTMASTPGRSRAANIQWTEKFGLILSLAVWHEPDGWWDWVVSKSNDGINWSTLDVYPTDIKN